MEEVEGRAARRCWLVTDENSPLYFGTSGTLSTRPGRPDGSDQIARLVVRKRGRAVEQG